MPIRLAAHLATTTKDPCEAVRKTIELVTAHASTLDDVQIELGLICAARRDVALRLAERLPSKTLGFRNLPADRALSAEQFQMQTAKGLCTFNGLLTEHLLPADAFTLIEQLLECPPSAIRSTAFNLNIKNICWKGSPQGSKGVLHLFDFKAFNRKERFALTAILDVAGDDPKSPELSASVRRVAEATGISFDIRRAARVPGDEGYSPARARAILVAQVCFEEAVENVAAQLPKHWISEFGPDALAREAAVQQRFEQWRSNPNAKVNLPSTLKRAIKQNLSEFKFETADPDQILFTKPISGKTEVLLMFERTMPRLGKAFTFSLGVRNVATQIEYTANVFEFERTTEKKSWVYSDAAEAEKAANEAVGTAKQVLPQFEACISQYFVPWPTEFPVGIVSHGELSAREAFAKAEPLAHDLFPDAALIRVRNRARSLQVRNIEGPELSFDGRLIPNAVWWFHFYSAQKDVSFEVTVPSLGRIRVLDHGKQYAISPNTLVPVNSGWMDSDTAFALAEDRGGKDRRNSGKIFGLFAKLEMTRSERACWGFMYGVADERGRNDLIVYMDAITGEPITDIHGF